MDAISSVFCAIRPNIGALLLFAAVIFSLIMAEILLNRKTDGCKHWVKLAAVRSSPQVQTLSILPGAGS